MAANRSQVIGYAVPFESGVKRARTASKCKDSYQRSGLVS